MKNDRLLNNAKWIIACKVIQSLIQLCVGMLAARYLGPSGYGLINYAASVTAFVIPIMQLGLHFTLVQEYVDTPEAEGEISGTGLILNLLSAFCCIAGVAAFSMIANRGERDTIIVCILYSISLLFQSFENLQCWFQAKLLSKYSSLAMLCAHLLVSAYKLWLLITAKSVYWFALSHAVEYAAAGILMMIAYRKRGRGKMIFSAGAAKRMLTKSKHYIPAALLTVIINSAANILLKLMVGERENGYYAAAVTSSVVVQFVYYAIIDSARPVILESKKQDQKLYEQNLARLCCIFVYLSLAQCLAFTVFAKWIVRILYGEAYMASVPVLQILIWQTPLYLMGWVRDVWILAEGKHSRLWMINLWGAAANLAVEACLIARWGACGAAAASVLTQIVINFVVGFSLKDIRPCMRLLLTSLRPAQQNIIVWRFLYE